MNMTNRRNKVSKKSGDYRQISNGHWQCLHCNHNPLVTERGIRTHIRNKHSVKNPQLQPNKHSTTNNTTNNNNKNNNNSRNTSKIGRPKGKSKKTTRSPRAKTKKLYKTKSGFISHQGIQLSNDNNYNPSRNRKLLVTKKEFNKVSASIKQGGFTIIPITLYFSDKGFAKLSCGIAKGKKKIDKRESIKQRDWNIKKQRLLKNN